jgi:hypothetical protein
MTLSDLSKILWNFQLLNAANLYIVLLNTLYGINVKNIWESAGVLAF